MTGTPHDFLHTVRDFELQRVLVDFPSPHGKATPPRVLDIGAGTGYQAAALQNLGYEVVAVDMPSSAYVAERVHPVIDYDGRVLPVPSASVDVVFSSNVLEHIADIDDLIEETRRVLAPGGRAIHVLPTPAWRWWTMLSHYGWLTKRTFAVLAGSKTPRREAGTDARHSPWRDLAVTLFPTRHGERGVTLTEPYYYARRWWCRTFRAHGFEVIQTYPVGLYYTGSMVLASRLPIAARTTLSRWLGSACRVYILRAADTPQ